MGVPRRPGVAGLTLRERDILRLCWHGLASKEIARLLGTSRQTVHNILRAAYRHLGLTDGDRRTRAAVLLWRYEHPARRVRITNVEAA